MKCCAECFGDHGLRKSIFPLRSVETGRCSYCNSEMVPVLAPSRLVEYFELLISAYQRDSGGKLLVEWFRFDWGLFEHPRMDDSRAKDLLAEILDDGDTVRQTFSPIGGAETDRLGEWEKLREELMYHNRFFPESNIDLERLELLLSFLALDAEEVPSLWYRARVQAGDSPYVIKDMSAPPNRLASHGRANPAGIPYLYLGSTPATAIAEIRPHTGESISVADFTTCGPLKLVDLRRPRKMVSPFLLENSSDISRMRCDLR